LGLGHTFYLTRSDAGALDPWWTSWSPSVEMAVWRDAVSWTRTSRRKRSEPRELGRLGANGNRFVPAGVRYRPCMGGVVDERPRRGHG
jgi:hypothetical protein